jgi:predicted hydrocarbon binding protein
MDMKEPDGVESGRVSAQPGPKHINVALFDPDKDIFLISVLAKNVPGALGDIATRVGRAGINILSISNSSEPNKPVSSLSFFAEPSTRSVTEDEFAKILSSSPYVIDVYTRKSTEALAVNDYNFPLTYYPGGRGIIFPVSGMASMFADMVSLFGSGGESILFRAGYSIGRQGSEEICRLFGEDNMISAASIYTKLIDALGWGKMEVAEVGEDLSWYSLRVRDSFECAGRRASKPTGHFLRGVISGSAERLFKQPVTCTEERCVATGSQFCRFRLELDVQTA